MEFNLINIADLLLVPVYFFLLYLVMLFIKKKNPDNFLIQKYLIKGFFIKVTGGVIYALLIYFYWRLGDTQSYFIETLDLRRLLAEGKVNLYQAMFYDYSYFETNFGFFRGVTESGFNVIKIATLLSYFSFSDFLVTTMLMGTIAYAGIFKLFQVFVSLAPKWHFFIAVIVLYFPSLALYGSAILKDTICFSCLGWFFYCANSMRVAKKISLGYIFIILFCLYEIVIIKAYIIAAFLIPYFIFMILNILNGIKSRLARVFTFVMLIVVFSTGLFLLQDPINDALGAYAVDNLENNMELLQTNYKNMSQEDAGSNFEMGPIEPGPIGIAKKFPVGIVATLFRPFVWEARKVIMLFSALESLFMLLFTLYVFRKAGFFFSIKTILTNANVFLFIMFSLLFAGMVGLSTLNFGTLARYRIPIIPFYLMGLLLILHDRTLKPLPVKVIKA
jgi:hypothetical protein